MKPFIHKEAWEATFRGFKIIDVAIRDRNFIYLGLLEVPSEGEETCDHDFRTRIAVIYRSETEPSQRWSHRGLENFKYSRVGASLEPVAQGMIASKNGDVYSMGSKHKGMEAVAERPAVVAVNKLRQIKKQCYAACMFRNAYRRTGVGTWQLIPTSGIPAEKSSTDQGFRDIDGFSHTDIYAVGGLDPVWHFDGSSWKSFKLPERDRREELVAVCCAGDGSVYIASRANSIFRGRNQNWQKIVHGEHIYNNYAYEDLRWFHDCLWLCKDGRVERLENGKLVRAEIDGEKIWAEHMDEGDGVIVFADSSSVKLYDGECLFDLVEPYC